MTVCSRCRTLFKHNSLLLPLLGPLPPWCWSGGLNTKFLRLRQLVVWYSLPSSAVTTSGGPPSHPPLLPSSAILTSPKPPPEAEEDVATISPLILRTFCKH
ncbi:hypothetical protein I79_016966 [Cricetulus griseus]|uniref:Uncharacterized protein n=1 Tax=Cricetulus griseus TaxID=10029 RepID=G3I0S7_CRIGR|nr:hypothetical protein I79_016966 [Cricetulus griseus]